MSDRKQPDLGSSEPAEAPVIAIHEPISREHGEPRDGYEPPPVWLWFFVIALMGFGGWYLGQYAADFDPNVYWDPAGMRAGGGVPAAAPTPVDPVVLGKRVYNNCMACHQADGRGVPGNYPPLDGSEWVAGEPVLLAALLLHGLEGEVVVHGQTYNQVMPSWSHLTDDQIAAVLSYIRSSWSNRAAAVAPGLVAAVRDATADRRGSWRAAELTAFAGGFEPPQVAAAGDAGPKADGGSSGGS